MIASFREDWLQAFFASDVHHRSIPAAIEARLFRRLQLMDDAKSDKDLRAPPSNHFEKLKGYLADYHSIRVNQKYRLAKIPAGVSLGRANRRSIRSLSRRPQLSMRFLC